MKASNKEKKDYLNYELLNGEHEVLFKGKAPECLEFYKKPENKKRVFWARKFHDSKFIKIETFVYLCELIDRFMPKSKKQSK